MKIAIITGASSGLGVEFFKEIQKEELDEVWVIARRKDRLDSICTEYGVLKSRVVPMDITKPESILELKALFESENVDIRFLINNAGFGIIGDLDKADYLKQGDMISLNVKALTEITTIALKHMQKGACIINTCSIASFVPNARMSVYSSTKAYVMSFSKALRYELKKQKINVTAICPGPMDTEFLAVAGIEKGVSHTFDTLPRCNVAKTAKKGIKASKRGRAVYTPHPFYKFYRVLAKVLPHSWLMGAAKT
jgi:short-subunit dehydrogenase